jgi:hypothetical protein
MLKQATDKPFCLREAYINKRSPLPRENSQCNEKIIWIAIWWLRTRFCCLTSIKSGLVKVTQVVFVTTRCNTNWYQRRYLYHCGREEWTMYSLEYGMMLQVLHQLGSSGEFHADIPPQAALRQGGYVILHVQDGNVIAGFILNKKGQKLYHDADVQRLLPKLGILDWQLVPSTPPKSASPNPPIAVPDVKTVHRDEDIIPQRRMVSPTQMRAWSTLERSVYSLADGTRTIEQIAKLLSRPKEIIGQVIHNFEISRVIEWHRR